MVVTQIFKLSSEKFKALTPEQMKIYTDQAATDKARHEKQKQELAKKGYYTLPDGSKSTDPQNAALLKKKKKRATKSSTNGGEADEE